MAMTIEEVEGLLTEIGIRFKHGAPGSVVLSFDGIHGTGTVKWAERITIGADGEARCGVSATRR